MGAKNIRARGEIFVLLEHGKEPSLIGYADLKNVSSRREVRLNFTQEHASLNLGGFPNFELALTPRSKTLVCQKVSTELFFEGKNLVGRPPDLFAVRPGQTLRRWFSPEIEGSVGYELKNAPAKKMSAALRIGGGPRAAIEAVGTIKNFKIVKIFLKPNQTTLGVIRQLILKR